MREAGIMLISTALTCAVIGNAYYQKKQFYPTVVHITKSNPSMTVIYTQGLILVFMINAFLQKIFFGTLRAAELEHLLEKVWYAVTETCLAFTVFRDDFSPKFIALFTLLLFLKSFHWLAEDRVDYMERSPVITWLFHLRLIILLSLLSKIDIAMIQYAIDTTVKKGPSVQLVFGFEYAILFTVVLNISVKYVLHTLDLQSENPWDNKPVYLLYTELTIGLLKVILYVAFVTAMVKLYTLPLFALRAMYYTMKDFKKAFHDIVMSRRAIRNMNTLYPDATAEELAAVDNVCIICREEMVAASKKLPCNHIFHTACLRSWFQRQQTCPTCRLNILRPVINNQTNRQQNQPRAAPQVPQAPQAPAFNPIAFWAGMQVPEAAPPLQQQQPQQQQQQPSGSGGTSQQQSQGSMPSPNNPSTPFQNLSATGVPLFPPPFPTMVPLPPLPTPPPNLTELSEEELRAMEGNLRQAVEARIQTLQRVQLLLDAASAMMNQYQTAAATANIPLPTTPTTASSSNVGTDASSMAKQGTSRDTSNGVADSEQSQAKTESNVAAANSSTDNANTSFAGTNGNDVATEESATRNSEVESPSDQEMLRRRRLQKFSTHLTAE